MIRAKLKAAAIHGLITIVTAAITACVVYFVWYPNGLAKMLSGTALYLIVLGVELCLGPVMSLVIFNLKKPRVELVRDYVVVVMVQIAALVYGLHSVALSRPVFLVFVKDRIEAVAATEIDKDDLARAKDSAYTNFSWSGPRGICTESPVDPQEKSDLLLSGLRGKDIQLMPKYYRECHPQEVIDKSYPKEKLFSATAITLNDLPASLQKIDFKWLPVGTRFGSGIVVYQNNSTDNPIYLNLDPFLARK